MKPTKVYRKRQSPAYTRKKFIGRIPDSMIKKFHLGNTKKDFPLKIRFIVQKDGQIADSALESIRTNLNRRLEKEIGPNNYNFHIHPIPHHFSREHGLTMAKAERYVKGMRFSFGKVNRRLARVKKGQTIITIGIEDEKHIKIVKNLLRIAANKLPFNYKIVID